MVIDILFALAFLLLGFTVGNGWSSFLLSDSAKAIKLIIGQLAGVGILIIVASWLVLMNSRITHLFPIGTLIGAIGWALSFRKYAALEKRQGPRLSLSLIPAATAGSVFSFLTNRSLTNPSFAYRVGPDFFGWSTSSKYFCSNENLIPLETRISDFLQGTPFRDSLLVPVPNGGKSLWQISSFTDQVNAEFLLQANRIGIQSFLGSVCRQFGVESFSHVFIGFAIWSVVLTVCILVHFLRKFPVTSKLVGLYSILGVLNFSQLSVVLEGGYGQLILTPYFLLFTSFLIQKKTKFRELQLSLFLLVSVALVGYIDVLLLAIPVLVVFCFLRFLVDIKNFFLKVRRYTLSVGISILAGFPGASNALNTMIERITRPSYGGWDQGNLPLPANLLGIIPWLPRGLYVKEEINVISLSLSIFITTVVLIRIFNLENQKIAMMFTSLFFSYSLLFVMTYFFGDTNNYRIWKLGGYIGVISPYIYLAKIKSKNSKWFFYNLNFNKLFNLVIPMFLISSSLYWTADWLNSSKMTLNQSDIRLVEKFSENHDLQIINLSGAMFTMYGDIKYGAASRNFSVTTEKTFGDLKTLLIIPSSSDCSGSTCSHLPPKMLEGNTIDIISRGKEIDFIQLVPILESKSNEP